MNKLTVIESIYVGKACRTCEVMAVTDADKVNVFYIYNYEGISFRVFKSLESFLNFRDGNSDEDWSFDTEEELVKFLERYELPLFK